MPHSKKPLFQRLLATCILGLALNACGDDIETPDDLIGQVDSAYTPTLFISFETGPNAGRHQYILDGSQQSKAELKFNKVSGVTFLELRGLISLNGNLRIDELRRFTKGELKSGVNSASTWRAESSDINKQCGALNLRDPENRQNYQNAFGEFSQCGDTTIDSLSAWKNAEDSVTMIRITKGQFSDRVKFAMSMDNAPFQRFETKVMVEFDLLETAARF